MAKRNPSDILKEYLIAINYQVDEQGQKKTKDNLQDLAKRIENIGLVAAGSAALLSTSVVRIAEKLEKLYYASQRTGASASNLLAFKYSAEQIGVSAEQAQASVENLAQSLRMNPGLNGLLKSLNVNPEQDRVKVLLDLVDRLRRMPFYQGARVASLFGIDENTLFMLEKNFDQLKKYQEERQRVAQQAGLTAEQMTEQSHKFMQELRGLEQRISVLTDLIGARFLPVGEKVIHFLDEMVDYLIKADKATDGWSSKLLGLVGAVGTTMGALKILKVGLGVFGIGGAAAGGAAAGAGTAAAAGTVEEALAIMGGGALAGKVGLLGRFGTIGSKVAAPVALGLAGGFLVKWIEDRIAEDRNINSKAVFEGSTASNKLAAIKAIRAGLYAPGTTPEQVLSGEAFRQGKYLGNQKLQSASVQQKTPGQLPEEVTKLIDKYAALYHVDPALAKAQAYQESHGNQNAISKKGALGVFQLMPKTANDLRVDPTKLESNIAGGVHHLANLLEKYGGNQALALAAYNAGGGNVAKYQGIPPFAETIGYVNAILANADRYRLGSGLDSRKQVVIHQDTKINVDGSGAPQQTAQLVLNGQERVNGDLVRNMSGNMH